MKQINSIEELTEGQEVYIKARYEKNYTSYTARFIICERGTHLTTTTDLLYDQKRETSKLELFTAEPVGNSEELDDEKLASEIILMVSTYLWDENTDGNTKIKQDIIELLKKHKISEQLQLPEIFQEYDISYDGVNWFKETYTGLTFSNHGLFQGKHIRPLQQPTQEELKAIELLKSRGYTKIEK